MNRNQLIEPRGFVFSAVVMIYSLYLFYSDTQLFTGSFAAAILAGLVAWLVYIGIRFVIITIRS